jgi:hypothetical protein
LLLLEAHQQVNLLVAHTSPGTDPFFNPNKTIWTYQHQPWMALVLSLNLI